MDILYDLKVLSLGDLAGGRVLEHGLQPDDDRAGNLRDTAGPETGPGTQVKFVSTGAQLSSPSTFEYYYI